MDDRKKKILIVDDNPSIRTFIRVPFQTQYSVFEAEDAMSAVESCKANSPDLVILDLGLPDEDGFYVLEKIRQSNLDTKVIILTVRDDNVSRNRAEELNADYYMTKPFRFNEISDLVGQII